MIAGLAGVADGGAAMEVRAGAEGEPGVGDVLAAAFGVRVRGAMSDMTCKVVAGRALYGYVVSVYVMILTATVKGAIAV